MWMKSVVPFSIKGEGTTTTIVFFYASIQVILFLEKHYQVQPVLDTQTNTCDTFDFPGVANRINDTQNGNIKKGSFDC
jgi:hypothetical protein